MFYRADRRRDPAPNDKQGEGGYGRDAGNAGQNCEPLGEVGIGLNLLEDRRLDRRDLAFDLFEALCIVAFQQRRGKDLAAILGGGSVFTRASRAR